jgi:hypothetical protein
MSGVIEEIAARTRRIETRLTKLSIAMGCDPEAQLPRWDNGTIHVPTMSSSLRDILAVLPGDWDWEDSVDVMHDGEMVVSLFVET